VVLEHQERAGKKILISGGGRCNFTNLYSGPQNFLSANDHFCKSALSRFKPSDFIDLVTRHNIEFYEKTLGQLFCKVSAKQITGLLLSECKQTGVKVVLNCKVSKVKKEQEFFKIETSQGRYSTASLVIATGGLSFTKMGASDFGYRIARQFGIQVHECQPALVPLTWNSEDHKKFGDLSGISLDAKVSCAGKDFREAILFTHRGLSGPAILQISSYWKRGELIRIDLFPDFDIAAWLIEKKAAGERSQLKNIMAQFFPKRFCETWCKYFSPSKPLQTYTEKKLQSIAAHLHQWEVKPAGDEGYEKAEVTLGGVDTDELSSKTLESRKIPGLYFMGEVVDVTGHLGGHNFQWAWASGFAAGQVV
jgi:hypothetical protein